MRVQGHLLLVTSASVYWPSFRWPIHGEQPYNLQFCGLGSFYCFAIRIPLATLSDAMILTTCSGYEGLYGRLEVFVLCKQMPF